MQSGSLAFDEAGHPLSARFGDVYRSRAGAFAEARHVFLEGSRATHDWSGRARFTILEAGFGLGVNFLATLAAWRTAADPPQRLNYVAIEGFPLTATALREALTRLDAPAGDRDALVAQWPLPIEGVHTLSFEAGAVCLRLVLGDVEWALARLDCAADAIFLDGFAPARNPAMWSSRTIRGLARRARPDAGLATYTAATAVRGELARAGFEVTLRDGFGGKRECVAARYRPRWRTWPSPAPPPRWARRSAAIIGGGLAGSAMAATLAARGWRVAIVEQTGAPGGSAATQERILTHLHVSPDDNPTARLSRAALTIARGRDPTHAVFAGPAGADDPTNQTPIGKLALLAADATDRLAAAFAARSVPPEYACVVDAARASELAGVRLARGGVWLPQTWRLDAGALCRRWLGAGQAQVLHWRTRARALQALDDEWLVCDERGEPITRSDIVILASADAARVLAPHVSATLRRTRGQSTRVDSRALSALRCGLGGGAYACPLDDGAVLVGSTFDESDLCAPRADDDASNLRRLATMLAGDEPMRARSGGVGFRFNVHDRLPLIGAVPDPVALQSRRAEWLTDAKRPMPVRRGLYLATAFGARGALWAPLAAAVIGAAVDGDPAPIERDLLDAIDPARCARAWLLGNTRGALLS